MANIAFRALCVSFVVLRAALCSPQLASITAPGVLVPAEPALAQPASAAPSCGGCYIVADVAGIVWYSQIFINTAATAVVGVGVGNGTRATRTSVIQNEAPFTIDPGMLASEAPDATSPLALTSVQFEPTVTINGATLRSPTAYNVFSAYSITSAFVSNGACVTTSGSRIALSSAFSEILPSASGRVTLDIEGERSFIEYLGFTTCSAGGASASPVALVQVQNLTATTTMTFNSVPLAGSFTLAPSNTRTSTATPAGVVTLTEVLSSITVTETLTSGRATASAPAFVIGNTTITPSANPLPFPFIPGNATIVVASGSGGIASFPGATGGPVTTEITPFLSSGNTGRGVDVWTKLWALAVGGIVVGAGML